MILSVILEQRVISVVVSHPDTLKHCVASRFALTNQHNHTKLGLTVILTSFFLNPPEIDKVGFNVSRF